MALSFVLLESDLASNFKNRKQKTHDFDPNTSFCGFILSKELKRRQVMLKNMFTAVLVIIATSQNSLKISNNHLNGSN